MIPKNIDPVVTLTPEDKMSSSVETHPAYAQIGASRVSGKANLYGSDFTHNGFMMIRIHASKLHRSLHNDWHHAGEEYIEVELSEAQWATFVSTPNMGQGVPCTLRARDGVMVPGIAHPPERKAQFTNELAASFARVKKDVALLKEQLNDAKISNRAKDDLLSTLRQIEMGIGSNLEFAAKTFTEHVETVTEHAKIEVAAYMTSAVTRLGMAALKTMPLELDARKTGEDDDDSHVG